jgi:hypothetical protein
MRTGRFAEPRLRRADGSLAACASCHDANNVGSSTITGATFDIGVSDESRRSDDVPLYTFRNKATGETRSLTDPGRGLVTGKWSDLGRFKAPMLRDLAARARQARVRSSHDQGRWAHARHGNSAFGVERDELNVDHADDLFGPGRRDERPELAERRAQLVPHELEVAT